MITKDSWKPGLGPQTSAKSDAMAAGSPRLPVNRLERAAIEPVPCPYDHVTDEWMSCPCVIPEWTMANDLSGGAELTVAVRLAGIPRDPA